MSNVKKGLAALKQHQEEQKAKEEARNRPKADWFSSVFPKKLGDEVVVRFLQELDPEARGYSDERGLGFIAVEHQAPGPEGYKRRALCTADSEGQCYACERHNLDYKEGWRQRQNLYINVLVKVDGESKVFVLSRNANSSFAEQLIQEAVDEGSITDANYRITKTGSGTQTNWLLKRLKGDPMDDGGAEVFNLDETALREVPYEKQADYYGAVYNGGGSSGGDSEATASASTGNVDEEW
jgi:hypothetical protein